MNTFTKGPWLIDDLTVYAKNNTPHKDNSFWVSVCRGRDDNFERISFAEAKANARLIAAAPDLLEAAQLALKIAESWIHDQLDGTSSIDGALRHLDPVRAAIARARGEA